MAGACPVPAVGDRRSEGLNSHPTQDLASTIAVAVAEVCYRAFRVIMLAAIAIHFRRVTVIGLGWVPRRGGALIAANHPSTWSDVLLLETLLGRRLHFLAEMRQFRPRPRAILLRVFGTLPVHVSESEYSAQQNEETFRRCRRLFDRGEAVAIFPEGISRTDRSLMPLKRGVSRLALSYTRPEPAGRCFGLVPVALRYTDRTAFRADVVMRIGEPIPLSELRASYSREDPTAVERLTARIAGALHSLGAMADDPADEPILAALEPIAAARRRDGGPDPAAEVLRSVSVVRREDPERYARLRRLALMHARALRALRVSDRALRRRAARPSWSPPLRLAALVLLALPALAGAVIHAIPLLPAGFAIRRCGYGPSQIAFARISAGFFFLTFFYMVLGWCLLHVVHVGPWMAAAMLAASAMLGVIALAYGEQLRPSVERWRVAWIARRHPGLVDRARESGEALSRWVSERGPASGGAS